MPDVCKVRLKRFQIGECIMNIPGTIGGILGTSLRDQALHVRPASGEWPFLRAAVYCIACGIDFSIGWLCRGGPEKERDLRVKALVCLKRRDFAARKPGQVDS